MKYVTLVDLPNNTWAVHWPDLEPVYKAIAYSNKRFLHVIADMGCWRVGLGLSVRNSRHSIQEHYVNWIDLIRYNKSELEDMEHHWLNDLCGFVFEEEKHAREFAEYIDRHITWKALCETV